MKIVNYNSIKHKLRRYSLYVLINMDRAGWKFVCLDEDPVGEKSVDLVMNYHKAMGNPDDTEYCYRRFRGAYWGLPLLEIYINKSPNQRLHTERAAR